MWRRGNSNFVRLFMLQRRTKYAPPPPLSPHTCLTSSGGLALPWPLAPATPFESHAPATPRLGSRWLSPPRFPASLALQFKLAGNGRLLIRARMGGLMTPQLLGSSVQTLTPLNSSATAHHPILPGMIAIHVAMVSSRASPALPLPASLPLFPPASLPQHPCRMMSCPARSPQVRTASPFFPAAACACLT